MTINDASLDGFKKAARRLARKEKRAKDKWLKGKKSRREKRDERTVHTKIVSVDTNNEVIGYSKSDKEIKMDEEYIFLIRFAETKDPLSLKGKTVAMAAVIDYFKAIPP